MKKLIFLSCLFSVLFSCRKDCDTHNTIPGRYNEECSCKDGGVNFHGECISNNSSVFYGEYNGKCRVSFCIVLNSNKNQVTDYQYSYDVRPIVFPKYGTLEEGKIVNSDIFCEEYGDNSISYVNYSYKVPAKEDEEVEVVFKTIHRITDQVLESQIVILKKI